MVRYPSDQALDYAALTSLVRDLLPTEGPFVVLGESFSGPIAITLAAEAPPRMQGLILCCTFARNPYPGLAPLKHLLPLMPLGALPTTALDAALLGKWATPALRAVAAQAVRQVAPNVLRARMRAALSVDVRPQLAQLEMPCLYLQASHDRLVPPSAAKLIEATLPSTVVMPLAAPHGLLQTVPAAAALAVSSFIEGLVRKQPADGPNR